MYMNENEIVDKFKRADNKKEMLQVLAELNGCRTDDMKNYLLNHGFSESDFPAKRSRKKKTDQDKAEANIGVEADEIPYMEPIKSVAQMKDMSGLTEEEERRLDRAASIPVPVRRAIEDKIEVLRVNIMELEKERDCLCDYLEGVI